VNLFAYLLLHPRVPHRREMLADLLSPDAPPERVRRNFSDTLYRLRQTLGDGWLEIESSTVALKVEADLWVDVWEFERLAESGQDADLLKAAELYTGDLLPEIYDEWILGERELRRTQYLSALETLASHKEAEGELQDALLYTRRLIATDPLHEPAHQSYLRLLGRLQRYGEALAHYDYLCKLFRSELDAEPLAETRALAQAIETERSFAMVLVPREPTSFVGRVTERATALAAVENALAGHGSIFAIEGEAGIGKSRFVREIAASARWRGVTVLQAVASETPSASPFQPVSDALAPFLNGPRLQQIEALLPAETLAALAPLYPNWRDHQEPRDALSEQASIHFYNALRPFGETLARLTPLLLAFDDLQWAAPVLWKSLSVLLPALRQNGALLFLVYRRPEIETTPGWEILQQWDRAGSLETISLQPLGVQEVAQLIGDKVAGDPVEIHALTGGTPFLICEWLVEPTSNQLARHYTAARRLHALSQTARGALESAAVLGESIPYQLWAEVCDLPPLALASIAEELTARHWLEPSASGYTFVHDLIRAAVYEQIQPTRRRELHQHAARAYSSFDPDNARTRAFHLDRAQLETEAAIAYRQAGEQDRERFAYREAQSAFERALALMPPLPDVARIETALALVQVCEITGDHMRKRTAANEALTHALQLENHELLLQALLATGRATGSTGQVADVREAKRHFREALILARESHDRIREIEALFELGYLANEQGEWNEAQKYYKQAQEQIREIGKLPHVETQSDAHTLDHMDKTIRSAIARQIGREPDLAKQLERELAIQRQNGNRLAELATLVRLLGAYYNLGDWDRLMTTAAETFPLAEAVGDRFKAATVQYIQGMAAYCLGDYSNARRLFMQVHEGYLATADQRSAGLAINMLGLVEEGEGNMDKAVELLQKALAGAEVRQTRLEAAYAQHDLGALLVRLDQPSEAIPLLEAACAAWTERSNLLLRVKSEAFLGLALLAAGVQARAEELASSGWAAFQAGVSLGELAQAWLWALYRLLTAVNRDEAAYDVLRAAYQELQRQARTIGDHALRHSFFANVWLNREIVIAHDQLGSTQRVITIQLARRSAPLGRALLPNEIVTIAWTVSAPEDEAIADKTERRLYRLQRLLQEAEAQDAAPTDHDLARALGVSRRTILRDMQAGTHDKKKPSTRKRRPK
jgi:DNA-binding SARP family transcriptional activator